MRYLASWVVTDKKGAISFCNSIVTASIQLNIDQLLERGQVYEQVVKDLRDKGYKLRHYNPLTLLSIVKEDDL